MAGQCMTARDGGEASMRRLFLCGMIVS